MNDKNGNQLAVGDTVTFTGQVTKVLEAPGVPPTVIVADGTADGHAFAPGSVEASVAKVAGQGQ